MARRRLGEDQLTVPRFSQVRPVDDERIAGLAIDRFNAREVAALDFEDP
jgi:hypothetical protein